MSSEYNSRIMIIIPDYFNINSPDNICFNKIIKKLSEEYIIDIVTLGKKSIERNSTINIYGVSKFVSIDTFLLQKLTSDKRIITKFVVYQFYVLCRLFRLFIWPDLSILNGKKLIKQSIQLLNNKNYKAVITLSGLISSQYVGLRVHNKKGITWIPYLYDPLPEHNFTYNRLIIKPFLHIFTNKILGKCNAFFSLIPPTLINSKYNYKGVLAGIPHISDYFSNSCDDSFLLNNNKINLLFVGSINPRIRRVDVFLSFIKKSNHRSNILCTVVGKNDYLKIKVKENGVEENFEFVDSIENSSILLMYKFNYILVNIGNKSLIQIPSKLVEYISTGLPIISIDPSTNISQELLTKYDNSICFICSKYNNTLQSEFDYFISREIKRLDYNIIKRRFHEHTLKSNVDNLFKIINEYGEKDY